MNIAGQFQPYQPAAGTDPNSGAMSVLQLRAFFGREWRLIALAIVISTLWELRTWLRRHHAIPLLPT